MTTKKILFFLLSLCFLAAGCHQKPATETSDETAVEKPEFSCDSAFAYVKEQTDFGPRVPGSEAHLKCCNYLVNKLSEFCDTAFVQEFSTKTYDGKSWTGKNIIASINPQCENRIVLSSHWDSRPFADHDPNAANVDKPIDGANDGASGVGVILEIMRQLQKQHPAIGVDVVLFDMEDYGPKENENINGDWWGLGAQYWAKHPHTENYTAMYGILLDMVGSANAKFYQEYFSTRDAQPIVAKIWSSAYQLGHGNYFINQPGGTITDDHYYVNRYANFKMIDIIHYDNYSGTGFDPTWHTMEDNINHIDKNTLGVVGTTLLQVIKNEK